MPETKLSFWKEINTRLPSIDAVLYEFFKKDDGSGSYFPFKRDDDRNSITLFMEREQGKVKKTEYIDPSIKEVKFTGNVGIGVDKKNLVVSWNGTARCKSGTMTECKIKSSGEPPVIKVSGAKKKIDDFRSSPKNAPVLNRASQTREMIKTGNTIELWKEAKTNVRDITGLAMSGGVVAAVAASTALAFLPSVAFLILASPMLVGATALANGEAFVRNIKGDWYLDSQMRDDSWFSEINVPPSNIESVTIKQDDEFYFHATVNVKKPMSCKIIEESDLLTIYPNRRLDCTV
jgi:hypothetical protein